MNTWGRGRWDGLAACAVAAAEAAAQPAPFNETEVAVDVDSGFVVNLGSKRGAAFGTIVRIPGAAWIRLAFDQAVLGEAPPGAQPTMLVATSLLDGAMQHHQALTLQQWGNTSAYFNGDAVRIEIVADPHAEQSRAVISEVLAGFPVGVGGICGSADDRVPSSDPRVCRMAPGGCTAFMISEYNNCFLSAGHCSNSGTAVAEFNVPPSNRDGTINHPGPEDQYAVDPMSRQFVDGGIGNDWRYFGCFPNTQTGLTPYQAQGAAYDLASSPPPVAGQTLRVTGYGVDSSPVTANQSQQTAAGPYTSFFDSRIQFQVDAQPGSSGSPVVSESDGVAIGILTHGGCIGDSGANNGTGSNNPGLRVALHEPRGVCVPAPPLTFVFPQGLPTVIDPADSIRVEVVGANGGTPQPGTGLLYYDAGGGFVQARMEQVRLNSYDAVFPRLECLTPLRYYFSAETTAGAVVNNPLFAPDQTHDTEVVSDSLEGTLLARDAAAGDLFGSSVAAAGDVVVVGARQDGDNGSSSGSAYVFRFDGSSWVQEQKLLASDGAAGDSFGSSVAAAGDVAIVGAYQDDDNGSSSGSAYVFRFDGSFWVQEQKLLASDGAALDQFGRSLAVAGDVAVVGADKDDDNGSSSGSAYVFRFDGSSWVQEQKLLPTDGTASHLFGHSVAVSGEVAVVGAYLDDGGSAYVFRHDGSSWVQEQKLIASDADDNESAYFGIAVSVADEVAVIGALGDTVDGSPPFSGSAYVFGYDGSSWGEEQKLVASDGADADQDGFGYAVAVSGDATVIGAYGDTDNGAGSGSAYVFRRHGSRWVQAQKLLGPKGAPVIFGASVAASSNVTVIGAPGDDDSGIGSGSAKVFAFLCCTFDLNGDGQVAVADFLAVLAAWGTSPRGPPDFDGDGIVDGADFEGLLAAWGPCP